MAAAPQSLNNTFSVTETSVNGVATNTGVVDLNASAAGSPDSAQPTPLSSTQLTALNQELLTRPDMFGQFQQMYSLTPANDGQLSTITNYPWQLTRISNLEGQLGSQAAVDVPPVPPSAGSPPSPASKSDAGAGPQSSSGSPTSNAWSGGAWNPANWSRGWWTGDANASDEVFYEALNAGNAVIAAGGQLSQAPGLAMDLLEIGAGSFMVAGGGTTEFFSLGTSSIVSVPAVLFGTTLVANGVDNYRARVLNIMNPEAGVITLTEQGLNQLENIGVPRGAMDLMAGTALLTARPTRAIFVGGGPPTIVYDSEMGTSVIYNPGNAIEVGGAGTPISVFTGRFARMNPNELRFSQNTAGGGGRAANLRNSMQNGWSGPAVDAVQTIDGIVTIDNTRIAIARELGITEVPVKVRLPMDLLPESMLGRFGGASTWGEALQFRIGGQRPQLPPTGTPYPPRLPN